jgi:serine/threonine-protein kinase
VDNLGYRANHKEPGKQGQALPFTNTPFSPVQADDMETSPAHTSILDGYEFGEKIGEGGMAAVYRGQQLSLRRPVAIKMLNQQMAKHSQVYEAFEREAVIIARLNHPNIIHVIDRGITHLGNGGQGRPFFIMEFIDGIDLARLIQEGHLPLQKKIEICLQICKALSYAHKNGVIHRDVKPGNVIVDEDFNVKVLDFGIALFYQDENVHRDEFRRHDNPGKHGSQAQPNHALGLQDGSERDVMGTFNYMAPELNASAAQATALSDIYSLGVIMYELFAGHLPSHSQRLQAPKETPLPASVASLVMRCLSPEPQKRPRSMIELHDQLLVLLRGAHLDKQRVKRANDSINNRKTFSLLDIIREQTDSAVYLFIEKHSGHQFVVKKTTGDYSGFETGQHLAQLSHRNIVRVHGTSKNERAFIVVTDYQRGGSLQERLVQAYKVENFLLVARQICRGLAFAHQHNIVHGNLRPSNILFDENDVVKVGDFGLSHHVESSQSSKAQALATAFSVKDEPHCPQKDLYACGVIFHLMLLSALPRFHNDELQTGRAFKRLPEDLQHLLQNLLQRNLVQRYKNVQQILADFEKLSDAMPTQVWSKAPKPGMFMPANNKKKVLLLLLCVLLTLLAANAGFFAAIGEFGLSSALIDTVKSFFGI